MIHIMLASVYLWLAPHGFPIHHDRFWLNSVAPLFTILLATAGLVAIARQRYRYVATIEVCFASAWTTLAVAGSIWFPISLPRLWWFGVVVASIGSASFLLLKRKSPVPAHLWIPSCLVFAILGVLVIWMQLPPRSTTIPFDASTTIDLEQSGTPAPESIGDRHHFYPAAEQLKFTEDNLVIHCSPLLTFDRVCPDGFWSLFAPANNEPRSAKFHRFADGTDIITYSDGSTVQLHNIQTADEIQLTAHVPLKSDTYSHLNSFCSFDISGHKHLALVFSPCPRATIEVLPADYPTGRAARFAYFDGSQFVIVEAQSGEKGPFQTLARGPMQRSDPLTITINDDGVAVASIVLDDWARQASTALSPTAGWGVPVNAIEFQRGEQTTSSATIWISLAGTSIGRGWESVGHRTGTYRNRIRVVAAAHGDR